MTDGATATFSVSASGSGLQYAWQRNGTPIPGAAAPTYITPPLALADNGAAYAVRVSNGGGAVLSQPVSVTVQPVAPAIVVQPQAASADDGAEVTFAVHASGSQPFTYQWSRDGVAIPGATASSYALAPAGLADHGATFSVQVGNVAGNATSQAASLVVRAVPPHIDLAPQAQTVPDGNTAHFSVSAHGSGTLAYQWEINGQAVPGAMSAQYDRTAAYADNGAQVRVVVTSAYGSAASTAATLTVDPRAPVLFREPQSVTMSTGATTTFTVTAGGTVPLTYQWQRSNDAGSTWSDIAGATAPDFTLADATLAWTRARLRVRVSNLAGSVNSEVVTLVVQPNVRVIAGKPGFWGYADGQGSAARFGAPTGIVADAAGNLLVADLFNGVIRQVTPQGEATTVAGRFGVQAVVDGPPGVASFTFPIGLARAADGTLYVGDTHRVRRIAPDGTVSTLAGSGTQGIVDGSGAGASFGNIRGLALDPQGNVLVADGYPYNVIRRVTPAGVVTTLAGVPQQPGSVDGPGATARFQDILGLTVNAGGTIYVADSTTVRRVLPDGTVSLYAGAPQVYGSTDGPRLSARFTQLHSVAFDALGNLWVGDSETFRRIATDGAVTTVAGGGFAVCPHQQMVDGAGAQACLQQPSSMVALPDGSGLAFTSNLAAVRKVSLGGTVTTLAGAAGQNGGPDGTGENARFFQLEALARDQAGNVWVSGGGLGLRRVTPAGTVTSLPLDPASGVFPMGLAFDAAGNFVVTDQRQRVMRISPAGVPTLVAGQADVSGSANGNGGAATFSAPKGLAVAPDGIIYVADFSNSTIRRISPAGDVTTVAGVASQCGITDGPAGVGRLCNPLALALDGSGRLYITDAGAFTVRRLDPDGTLHTVAGTPFSAGFSEGNVSRFRNPTGIGVDSEGNVYVADSGNGLIRRIDANGVTTVVVGRYGMQALRPGLDGAINKPGALLVLPTGRLVFGTEQVLAGD